MLFWIHKGYENTWVQMMSTNWGHKRNEKRCFKYLFCLSSFPNWETDLYFNNFPHKLCSCKWLFLYFMRDLIVYAHFQNIVWSLVDVVRTSDRICMEFLSNCQSIRIRMLFNLIYILSFITETIGDICHVRHKIQISLKYSNFKFNPSSSSNTDWWLEQNWSTTFGENRNLHRCIRLSEKFLSFYEEIIDA